jgi:cytochrome c-type biogenesis protein CcmH/NrfF
MSNVMPTKVGSVVEGSGGKPLGLAGQVQIVAPAVDPKAAETATANAEAENAKKETEKVEEDKLAKAKEIARRGNAARQAWARKEAETAAALRRAEEAERAAGPLRERIARAEQLEAQLRSDPLAALQLLGVKAEDAYKRAVMQGKPEALIEQLRAEVAEERKAREAFEQRQAQQSQAQQIKALESDFIERCGDVKQYPALAGTPSSVLLYAAKQLGAELYQRTNQGYSNQELLAFLNERYAAHQKESGGKAEKDPKTASGATERKSPATSRTISNDLSTQVWSKPPNWSKMSDLEQRQFAADQVRGRLISKRT